MKKQKLSSNNNNQSTRLGTRSGFWDWIDKNLLHWSFIGFIVAIAVVPKFPIQHVEYTYIRIRIDDLLPAILVALFTVQWIRRKITLNRTLLIPIILFWISVFVSFLIAYYITYTIPVFNIGLLHSLRRVQYMIVFFIASSLITSEKRFYQYLKTYVATFLVVCVYGLIQKFGFLPSIQSMNPAYTDGRLLWLNPDDRINSTFGGHFDLAAYITFTIPLVLGMYYATFKKWYLLAFFASLTALLYTAARSSFVAYVSSITFMLFVLRKFKFYVLAMVVTAGLMLVTGDMTKRLLQTFQVKTVYTNELTGQQSIGQKITVKNLPAGSYEIDLPFLKKPKSVKVDDKARRDFARDIALDKAKREGKILTAEEIEAEAGLMTRFIKPEQTLLCDISCATRLQVEWPRAILAFKSNPLFGRGPSSITEATDNDYLRWLGELGIVGTSIFVFILLRIMYIASRLGKKVIEYKTLAFGFICGVLALLINSLYVDVFEASKMAYNFWVVSGLFVGIATFYAKNKA